MRILGLCADLGIPVLGGKGAAVHVRAMAEALQDAGHRVVLVASMRTRTPWEPEAPCAVPIVHVPPSPATIDATAALRAFARHVDAPAAVAGEVRRVLHDRDLLAALRRQFEHQAPDLVYERASLLGTAGLTFAREVGAVHLLELNAPLADEHRQYRQGGALDALAAASDRWLLTGTDGVLAVSSPLAAHVRALGAPADRVHVVPNGVDVQRFSPGPSSPAVRARYGLGDGPIVGFVGGLRPWHGVDGIPRVLARLAMDHRDVQGVVVGDGPLRAELERAADAAGVRSRLHLLGAVPHDAVAPLIREFAVAIAPYPEAAHAFYFSPLKIFEYLACGAPTVAAALGQIADVVEPGVTGLLHPPGDLDACAAACHALLRDRPLAARLGAAAADAMRASHTWAHNAARVAALATACRRGLAGVSA